MDHNYQLRDRVRDRKDGKVGTVTNLPGFTYITVQKDTGGVVTAPARDFDRA